MARRAWDWAGALVVLALLSGGRQAGADPAPAPLPLPRALAWLAHPDPDVHGRAFDVLVQRASLAQVTEAPPTATPSAGTSPELQARKHGVYALIRLAERLKASAPASVARFLLLEEGLGSAWSGHVGAMLARAGLAPAEADALLAERAQAQVACLAYLDSQAVGGASEAALAEVLKVGPALVPHLLQRLAVPAWIATQGWPGGAFVIHQRACCWALKAMRTMEAIPYLCMQVQSPSSLAWDALDTLHALTGDAAFKARSGAFPSDSAVAHRVLWWKDYGSKHAASAQAATLAALRHALSWLTSRFGDPLHWTREETGGTPRDPLHMLFEDAHMLVGLDNASLPPAAHELGATDLDAWMPRLRQAIQGLERR